MRVFRELGYEGYRFGSQVEARADRIDHLNARSRLKLSLKRHTDPGLKDKARHFLAVDAS